MVERVNMKQVTARILESIVGLADFSTDYPSSFETFPVAIYRTVRNPHFINGNKVELQTNWTIVIEIYGESNLASLAEQLVDTFYSIGFTGNQRDSNTAGLKRIVCTFTGMVDNESKFSYIK